MDIAIRLFALLVGALFAYEAWRAFGDRADTEPGWIAALMGETLDAEASPIRFWAFVVCQSVLAAAFIVAAFLPATQMRALLDTLTL